MISMIMINDNNDNDDDKNNYNIDDVATGGLHTWFFRLTSLAPRQSNDKAQQHHVHILGIHCTRFSIEIQLLN